MKKIFTLYALLFIVSQNASAKIWRINNNLGIAADFTDIPAAVTAAAAGDTIMVEASATTYSGPTLTKKLIIIGTGYYLTETSPAVANPKTQANTNIVNIGQTLFNSGSAGSVIEGVSCNNITLDESSITIERNNISSIYILDYSAAANIVNDTIRQNVIGSIQTNNPSKTASNLLIYNNIISSYGALFGTQYANFSGYYINNIFLASSGYTFTCSNFTFQNNIFNGSNFGSYLSSNAFFNNLEVGNNLPSGNGNVHNVNLDNVFVGYSSGTGFSSDGRYKLKAGSLASGAGSLNSVTVDCGAFGGPAPYILSGMPSIPSIYVLTVPSSVPSGATNINITISSTTVH